MQKFESYVQSSYPDKPSSDQLCLPANALLTRGERDALSTRSVMMVAVSGEENSSQVGNLYQQSLALETIFREHVQPEIEQLLGSF